ncbi:adenosylmethionine decarboxylase [Candidatus Hodarchaeum mangrovi]
MHHNQPTTFFNEIASKANLEEGAKGVERVVKILYRYRDEKLSNKVFSRLSGIPVPVLAAVKGELMKSNFLISKYQISNEGIKWVENSLGLRFSADFFDEFINMRTLNVDSKYLEYFKPVIEYLKKRPDPDYRLDQSHSLPETVIKRTLLMLEKGDVEGKKIVILGDDDGVSIALAHLRCAREIFVLDIDSRIVNFINHYAAQNDLKNVLTAKKWDIRSSFPTEWVNKFDVFETDPPYTVSGFEVFLNQAINLLKIGEGRGYLSFGFKTPHDTWKCQQLLLQHGFIVEEFLRDFNKYLGSTILGNSSNLYIVDRVSQKIRRYEFGDYLKEIYTSDEKKIKDLPTIGYQIVAEFYGVKKEYLTNLDLLTSLLIEGIIISGLKKEEIFQKEFFPYGVSVIAILLESHAHIHTWPEWDYLSLDIFVCEAEEKAEKLFQFLLKRLNPIDYHRFQFFRGKPPEVV